MERAIEQRNGKREKDEHPRERRRGVCHAPVPCGGGRALRGSGWEGREKTRGGGGWEEKGQEVTKGRMKGGKDGTRMKRGDDSREQNVGRGNEIMPGPRASERWGANTRTVERACEGDVADPGSEGKFIGFSCL